VHLNCTGDARRGEPTVILEAGAGDFSFDWSLVQASVQHFSRVCSYDRAGSAWSDLGPRPRTLRQSAYELHALLRNAGERPPFVMVGHSLGGLIARQYAQDYRGEVAGVVLVDATSEHARLNINGVLQRVRDGADGRATPPVQETLLDHQRELSAEELANANLMLSLADAATVTHPYDVLPTSVQTWRLWAMSRPSHYVTDDDPYFADELAAIYETRRNAPASLGDMPLVVISRDLSLPPEPGADAALQAERYEWQRDLARLSARARLIVAAGSGHHVQLERPDIVVAAIQGLVEEWGDAP
jgi:pimeloyl-ACP methyl ester carboxylesterase